jgi:predicted metal-dependent phosphoesterase TrpH
MTNAKMTRIATQLKESGLDAIEAYYPEHSDTNTATVLDVSRRLGLLISGGSDFHGDTMPTIALGTGRGTLNVPDTILPPLREAATQRRKHTG